MRNQTVKRQPLRFGLGCDRAIARCRPRSLKLRAEIAHGILAEVERRKLTQTRAAAMAGVSQPRMSDLMRGRVDLFSLDALRRSCRAPGPRDRGDAEAAKSCLILVSRDAGNATTRSNGTVATDRYALCTASHLAPEEKQRGARRRPTSRRPGLHAPKIETPAGRASCSNAKRRHVDCDRVVTPPRRLRILAVREGRAGAASSALALGACPGVCVYVHRSAPPAGRRDDVGARLGTQASALARARRQASASTRHRFANARRRTGARARGRVPAGAGLRDVRAPARLPGQGHGKRPLDVEIRHGTPPPSARREPRRRRPF